MKKNLVFLPLMAMLVLVSCNNSSSVKESSDVTPTIEPTTTPSSVEDPTTNTPGSEEPSTNSSTSSETPSTNTETSSDTSTNKDSSETPSSPIPVDPTSEFTSIEDVVVIAKSLTMPTSQPHVVEDKDLRFKIKGHVLDNYTSGTTKSGYTPDGKTVLIDSTGWISCASVSASSTSLYQKVSSYLDKDTTQYEVIGHVSLSFGTPELVVESFTWNQSLDIQYVVSPTKEFNSLSEYYSDSYNIEYNCKGNGTGEIVKLNNLTCVGRVDNASTGKWAFIDENNKYLDVIYSINNNAFTPGNVYNLIGLQNTYHYNCSLRVLRHESSSSVKAELDTSKAVTTTIKELFNNYSFKDDSYNKVSTTYYNNRSNIYKVNAYINHFEKSGKWYITLSDSDYTPSAENNAYSNYQVPINNDGYWNTTEYSFSYKNLYSYENTGSPIDVYISLHQENHVSVDPIKTKAIWKVFLFEDLVPEYIEA